jgi:hypothetical protein
MGPEYYSVTMADIRTYLIPACFLVICIVLAGCTGSPNQAPAPTPTPAPGTPGLTITSPADGAVLSAGNITVLVSVFNFKLVPSYGQAYVAGEGHLHYYMDLPVPVTEERAPVTPLGRFVPSSDTSHTFANVPAGSHNFSVELANNDHSPFPQPIFRTVTVRVTGQLPATATVTAAG